ncbi:MAG: hypothetical protein RL740_526 [Actinomycetota bacterium]|jgi:glucosyl-3-phosphoglycerate phosphatase
MSATPKHPHNKVVLWRHGQTDWNIENRFQGSTDIPLNENGLSQVARAGKLLTGLSPTQIISSDLSRAHSTAKALADLVNLEITKDQRLRETDGGKWEGKTGDAIRETDIENFIRWIDGDDNPAGEIGERRSEVAERATAAIYEALEGKSNQTLIVATHGGTARCIIGAMLDLPMSTWGSIGGLSNAAWSILSSTPRGWNLVEHNSGSLPEPIFGEESGGERE